MSTTEPRTTAQEMSALGPSRQHALPSCQTIEDSRQYDIAINHSSFESFRAAHEKLIAVAKRAIKSCLANHQPQDPSYPLDSSGFLPLRLIDLKILESPRLVVSTGIRKKPRRYVSLSHQWGSPDERTKAAMTTMASTLEARMKGIALSTLPERYQEAMMVCYFMRIRYIWIDSLCIVQDDLEDWKIQSAMMGRVYECAVFTISSNRPVANQQWQPPIWPLEAESKLPPSGILSAHWLYQMLNDNPLRFRAWCLQERYLSPRILHLFAGQTWIVECEAIVIAANEKGLLFQRTPDEPWRKFFLDRRLDHSKLRIEWYKIVSDYSNRLLSNKSDKLPAISAMAAKMHPLYQGKYLSGAWEYDLYGLMWHRKDLSSSWHIRPNNKFIEEQASRNGFAKVSSSYRAPTWSWASIDNSVEILDHHLLRGFQGTYLATVTGTNIVLLDDQCPFGQVTQGSQVTLKGYFWNPDPRDCPVYSCLDLRSPSIPGKLYYFLIGFGFSGNSGFCGIVLTLVDEAKFMYERIGIFRSSVRDIRQIIEYSDIKVELRKTYEDRGIDEQELSACLTQGAEQIEVTII